MTKNLKKIIIALAGIAAIILFFAFDLGRFFTLAALKVNHKALLDYYTDHRTVMVAGFMALYVVQTALSLPGAAILSLASGALFGPLMGTVYAVLAATVGATLAFIVTRYLLRDQVLAKFGPKLEKINRELEERGLNYLLFLRLVPVFPFFLINLASGLTRLPLRTFVIGTLIGIIPGGFVYVNAGASLSTINSLREVASVRVLGSFALLGLFALIPVIYGKMKKPGAGDQGPGADKP
jgi:uncharacterized membrane protein YdjX (TVP38/TMEM64 family)